MQKNELLFSFSLLYGLWKYRTKYEPNTKQVQSWSVWWFLHKYSFLRTGLNRESKKLLQRSENSTVI